MRRWRVIVQPSARQDIEGAYLWIAERSPDAADRWFNDLYETIGSLELYPERCPLAPENEFFNEEIREIFHGRREHKYRILFTVANGTVYVLHVRHGARRTLGELERGDE